MADISCDRVVTLSKYIDVDKYFVYDGVFGHITSKYRLHWSNSSMGRIWKVQEETDGGQCHCMCVGLHVCLYVSLSVCLGQFVYLSVLPFIGQPFCPSSVFLFVVHPPPLSVHPSILVSPHPGKTLHCDILSGIIL